MMKTKVTIKTKSKRDDIADITAVSPSFNELLQNSRKVQKGCPIATLQDLTESIQDRFNMSLPIGYREFLTLMNGYHDFGLMLYASTFIHVGKSDRWIYGVIEMNKEAFKRHPAQLALGKYDDDLLVYDASDQQYKSIDLRCTPDSTESFHTFWTMIEAKAQRIVDHWMIGE